MVAILISAQIYMIVQPSVNKRIQQVTLNARGWNAIRIRMGMTKYEKQG
jgi:multisubunit Na+/H+ antiporter MnhC subunit